MIIAIDCGPLTLGSSGGIVQHLSGILEAYVSIFPNDTLLIFVPDGLELGLPPAPNVSFHSAGRRDVPKLLGDMLRRQPADVLIRSFPSLDFQDFPVERQIAIIPDMQHVDFPEFFKEKALRERRLAFGYVLSNAGAIGTNTQFSRKTILDNPWNNCEDVFLMPPGLRFAAQPEESESEPPGWNDRGRPLSRFFFMPANLWPHKNHRNLCEAFGLALPDLPDDVGLVLTGAGKGWDALLSDYRHLPIVHLGYIEPEHLRWLYRRALALTFFSSYEGFGMPLLEAFHFDTPVVCSDIPALVEVGGDAVLTAPPSDPAEMAKAMARVARDSDLRRSLAEKGRARLAKYTFRDSAMRLREAAERVIGRAAAVRQPRALTRFKVSALLDLSDPSARAAGSLEALLAQRFEDFEIIPFGVPGPLADDKRIRFAEKGPLASPSDAAAAATGDIVVLVRGDCRLEPTALQRLVGRFDERPECDVVAAATLIGAEGGTRKEGWKLSLPKPEAELSAADRRLWATFIFARRVLYDAGRDFRKLRPLVAWRRRVATIAGNFDDGLAYGYDADYYIRMVKAGGALSIVTDPLASVIISADAAAARYWHLVMKDLQKVVTKSEGRLSGRFFRLYRHRQRGLEPVATERWDLLLSLRAWGERSVWSARSRLGALSGLRPTA